MTPIDRQIIILLNGAGSSGKSTTARALQRIAALPLLHLSMDAFLDMLPEHLFGAPEGLVFRPVAGAEPPEIAVETGPVCRRLFSGMRHAVAAMARQGNSLVVDEVLLGEGVEDYRRLLAGFDLRLVGLFAPLDVLETRERQRGDRLIGLSRGQVDLVHRGIRYDLELDAATATPEQNAQRICRHFGI